MAKKEAYTGVHSPAARDPHNFYGPKHPRRRELLLASKRMKAEERKVMEDIRAGQGKGVKTLEEKEFDPKDAPTDRFCNIGCRVARETYLWIEQETRLKNCSVGNLIEQLVKCAEQRVVYHMERYFSVQQRQYYASEIRKQKRLEKIAAEKAALREKLKGDRRAAEHGIDPYLTEVE